jgi:hypothetical protein
MDHIIYGDFSDNQSRDNCVQKRMAPDRIPGRAPGTDRGQPSSNSVTSAAIGERSERVSVMCANNGCPLSFSITATTPS